MSLLLSGSGICPFCTARLSKLRLHPTPKQYTRRAFSRTPLKSRESPAPRSRFSTLHQPRSGSAGTTVGPHPGSRKIFIKKDAQYGVFEQLVLEQTDSLLSRLELRPSQHQIQAWGITSRDDLRKRGEIFKQQVRKVFDVAKEDGFMVNGKDSLLSKLKKAFVTGEVKGLSVELQYAFLKSIVETRLTPKHNDTQKKLADLRYPLEFYPATRALQRTIHLHVGPTNSGKTYTALKRLEEAKTGIYAGPLRLLAHEVYTRFNAKGKKCALITGEERRIPEDMHHVMSSCTVEMVPLNTKVDVAVIDEIQMIGDMERGWAWTQALLGVQADEVHVCGEVRTIELVTALCKFMGDKLEIHNYERLSPLQPMTTSLNGDLRNLQKGDAVILFSRLAIHAMKAAIEKATGKRCAVVYGSLPPETRAQQAALFNDPNNDYDYLAASDAVGMGLNLSIKRIVFEATSKHDGTLFRPIQTSELKQIAGRAGRYKTAHDAIREGTQTASTDVTSLVPEKKSINNVGWVTTLEGFDLPVIQKAMKTDASPLKTAGLLPPSDILLRFASYFPPTTPFSYIILRVHDFASISSHFHLCSLQEQLNIADVIQKYNLSTLDRTIFINAPVALRDPGFAQVLRELAQCVADQSGGELLDIKSLNLELLDQEINDHQFGSKGYLRDAELLHKALTLYLWLSYRFTGVFRSQALAFHVKGLVEKKIDECLAEFAYDENRIKARAAMRKKALKKASKKEAMALRLVHDGRRTDRIVEDEETATPVVVHEEGTDSKGTVLDPETSWALDDDVGAEGLADRKDATHFRDVRQDDPSSQTQAGVPIVETTSVPFGDGTSGTNLEAFGGGERPQPTA